MITESNPFAYSIELGDYEPDTKVVPTEDQAIQAMKDLCWSAKNAYLFPPVAHYLDGSKNRLDMSKYIDFSPLTQEEQLEIINDCNEKNKKECSKIFNKENKEIKGLYLSGYFPDKYNSYQIISEKEYKWKGINE